MSNREKMKKWGYGSFGVGLVLSIVFFALFAAVSGELFKSAFLSAAMVCVIAGAYGLAVGISGELKYGKWTGVITGALGFVVWGIVWLANSCSAGDVPCNDLKTAFGWGAIFSAIGGLAAFAPELFGGSSAPSSSN
jgi:hypothetical protein